MGSGGAVRRLYVFLLAMFTAAVFRVQLPKRQRRPYQTAYTHHRLPNVQPTGGTPEPGCYILCVRRSLRSPSCGDNGFLLSG